MSYKQIYFHFSSIFPFIIFHRQWFFDVNAFDDKHQHILSPVSLLTGTVHVAVNRTHEHVLTRTKKPFTINDLLQTTTVRPTIIDFLSKIKKRSTDYHTKNQNKQNKIHKIAQIDDDIENMNDDDDYGKCQCIREGIAEHYVLYSDTLKNDDTTHLELNEPHEQEDNLKRKRSISNEDNNENTNLDDRKLQNPAGHQSDVCPNCGAEVTAEQPPETCGSGFCSSI